MADRLGVVEHEHRGGVEPRGVALRVDVAADAADEHEEVGLVQAGRDAGIAPVAEPPGVRGRVVRHGVVRAPVAGDGHVGGLGPRREARAGVAEPALAARDDERTLGVAQAGREVVDERGRRRLRGHRDGHDGLGRRGLADDVLGQADDDGARAARRRHPQRLARHLGGARRVVEHVHALGLGAEPGREVELLEGEAVAVGHRDEPDEEHERRRVLVRRVHGDHGVRRTRSARHHGHAGDAREAPLGEGHEPGPALLPADDGAHGGVVQSVEDVEEALAGHEVGPLDAGGGELLDDAVSCAGHVAGAFRCGGATDGARWEGSRPASA